MKMPKLCEHENCRTRAVYGYTNIPVKCGKHKEDKMKLSSSLCKCGKQANYNFKGVTAKYCVDCKDIGMVDVRNRKCYCGKSQPRFNFEGETPTYCNNCKENGMINLLFKKCKCGRRAVYNFKDLTAEFCSFCKKDEMINLEATKCHCGKPNPRYNYTGLKAEFCTTCKQNDMIDVAHKKCKCGKVRPTFNLVGQKAEYCVNCKSNEMVNVVDEMCFCGKSQPGFNYLGLKPKYCASCKLENMINVKDEKCKAENCLTRGNKNYKGYCTNCFQNLFPLDPLTFQIRSKTKEIAVRDFINSIFEGFQHDKPLWYNEKPCDCTTKRRIDHRKLINNTLLCIETDENQHKSYSKEDEVARYNDLFMAFGGKFIFIRFNPDKYKDKTGKSCNPMLVNRLPVLQSEINKQITRIENNENTELLEVIELYYDQNI